MNQKPEPYLIDVNGAGTLERCHFAMSFIIQYTCCNDDSELSDDAKTGLTNLLQHIDRSMIFAVQQFEAERGGSRAPPTPELRAVPKAP